MRSAAALALVGVLVASAAVAARHAPASAPAPITFVVRSVYDGDTLTFADGRRVRLVQIDAPELGSGECYSRAARAALVSLVPIGSRITLESDPSLDQVDRYGRLLRYVRRGGLNVNLELVRRGASAPYFYDHDRGRYAALFMQAAREARASGRGLWRACPSTVLNPYRKVATG
jgi:endonuclease YncB( thermonuclease family)